MSGTLEHAVRRMAGRRIVIVGDAVLDSYLEGRATRLSREAPVPVVAVDRRIDAPGGAANAAVNAAARRLYARLGFRPKPRPADLPPAESYWELRRPG